MTEAAIVEWAAIVVTGVVGILAWLRAGTAAKKANRIAEDQLEMQREQVVIQSKLAEIEEERLEQERRVEAERLAAASEISVAVHAEYNGHTYRVVIENFGAVDAREVFLRFHPPHEDLIDGGELEGPIPLLRPGDRVPLSLGVSGVTFFPFGYTLSWEDHHGHVQELQRTLYRP